MSTFWGGGQEHPISVELNSEKIYNYIRESLLSRIIAFQKHSGINIIKKKKWDGATIFLGYLLEGKENDGP